MAQQQRLPRGLRNNNPLNLRISNNPWLGKVKNNTDGSFEQFVSLTYGIRAAIINIRTMIRRADNRLTLRELITKWAPNSDGNNEQAYTQRVSDISGIAANDIINIKYREQIASLVTAMAEVENGTACITPDDVRDAYALIYPRLQSKEDDHQ